MFIRKLKEKDLSNILRLAEEFIDYHHQLDAYYKSAAEYKDFYKEINSWLKKRTSVVLVAEKEEKLIGYIRCSIEKAPYYTRFDKIGLIDDLMISIKHRQQGTGELLFKESLKWFKKKGAEELRLNVFLRNEQAVKFWEKMGFEKWNLRMQRVFGNNE